MQKISKDDIVTAPDEEGDQGRRLHQALSGTEPKELSDRLPEVTLARAVVDMSSMPRYTVVCDRMADLCTL